MGIAKAVIWLINIISAIVAIVLILMQQGKGADAGASFGSGSAQGVFGAAGSANFLSRSTAIAATVFFVTCLALGALTNHQARGLDFSTVKTTDTISASAPSTQPASASAAATSSSAVVNDGIKAASAAKKMKVIPD